MYAMMKSENVCFYLKTVGTYLTLLSATHSSIKLIKASSGVTFAVLETVTSFPMLNNHFEELWVGHKSVT